jgi:bisphosphoglycerate-dependent phosphoglycerate mutase
MKTLFNTLGQQHNTTQHKTKQHRLADNLDLNRGKRKKERKSSLSLSNCIFSLIIYWNTEIFKEFNSQYVF